MKIVIQCVKTGEYASIAGEFCPALADARDFDSSTQAEAFCRTHRLINHRILAIFPGLPPFHLGGGGKGNQ
jgi:hypothetical protein